MSKILVAGAEGQLGECLQEIVRKQGLSGFVFLGIKELDILNREQITEVFERERPDYLINCAAYTAVDKAEEELELCREINKLGALNLAKACADYGSTLIHVSTDFVFEGNTNLPLDENAPSHPIGHYGLTKLEGEKAVQEELEKYYIIRTSWLYSEYGQNFVKTMLRLGKEKKSLNVVADQIGTPTYAMDLAQTIIKIVETPQNDYGVYHYSNEGVASWYDFSKAIFELAGIDITVNPIPTSAFPTKAKRPVYSVLDKTKIKETLGLEIPHWRESLATCMKRLTVIQNEAIAE